MANEHLILCGGARKTSRKQCWQAAKRVELRTGREHGNVHLRISDISQSLTANLPSLDRDLLEIATYVYCGDQAASRGGIKEFDYGKRWFRDFRFEIAVREPDFWNDAKVRSELERTLNDLSGDNFEFNFQKLTSSNTTPLTDYFEFGKDASDGIEEVMLFSGGLDSFGGAVEEILERGRKVALVSHRSVTKIGARQRNLVGDIRNKVSNKQKAPMHIPVLVNKDKELGVEYTQRTRSFLYSSLAAVVARLFSLARIRFYENGVTSLNLPISPQVVSTRATRTTHPMVLAGFSRILSLVNGGPFSIENPFFWKTKTEIVQAIKKAGHARLCAFTSSCAHTWEQTKMHTHCGRCSQCIERRLVAVAAGLGDDEDPAEMYKHQVLTDPVEGAERVLAESFLETIKRIESIDTADGFCLQYPELARVINHVDGKADDVARAIWELYKRHAEQVGSAIDSEGKRLFKAMRLDQVPSDSMIRIAVSGRSFVAPQNTAADGEAVDESAIGVVVDEDRFSVQWNGSDPIEIGNRKEFWLLKELSGSTGSYISFTHLAERLGGDAFDDVKPIKSRLVKLLKEAGCEELASCIKTQKGHYALILPRNHKVNGAQS